MKNKSEFRILAKNIRKTLDIKYISEGIVKNILSLDVYKGSNNIMLFYPLNNEINLLPIIDKTKNYYLPRVKNNELEVCPYELSDKLIESPLKIKEPICDSVDKKILDIVLIPALACDRNFCRLGYGGGYYDRFLKDISATKIVVVPDELIFDEIPFEKFDINCDIIVTQKKASFFRG